VGEIMEKPKSFWWKMRMENQSLGRKNGINSGDIQKWWMH
jgi:hypothetical protein